MSVRFTCEAGRVRPVARRQPCEQFLCASTVVASKLRPRAPNYGTEGAVRDCVGQHKIDVESVAEATRDAQSVSCFGALVDRADQRAGLDSASGRTISTGQGARETAAERRRCRESPSKASRAFVCP
jgi:hypothetical protein